MFQMKGVGMMIFTKLNFSFILMIGILSILMFSSCSRKPSSMGSQNKSDISSSTTKHHFPRTNLDMKKREAIKRELYKKRFRKRSH